VRCRHRMASSPTDEDQLSRAGLDGGHGALVTRCNIAKGATAFGLLAKFAERGPR
jgi:hypothetical protein